MVNSHEITKLRGRIAEVGVRRQDIAIQLGISESLFSLYINGRRSAPEDFEARVLAALELLEEAECAAREARAAVLAQGIGSTTVADGQPHDREPVGV